MIPKLGKYDLIISHGMQSGVVLSLWKRLFRIKAKHIVFDIGSFNSASESGFALKLLQYASKSIDGLIYHTSSQIDYYKKFFPWIVDKSFFIHFGADFEFFNAKSEDTNENEYIVCAGKNRSDWDTLVEAYSSLNCGAELRLIGGIEEKFDNISGVKQFPYLSVNDFMRQVSGAKLCVLPLNSVKYSFGQMRFLQQMAMEKCVVASRIPSLIDYAQDTKTALFYEPGNVADCANKIKMALESDTLRKNIAKHAHESVVKYYSEKVMAKQIESVFNTVLGERKNG
jgi:glycosyltransferase involved in cell wall biosynthesis